MSGKTRILCTVKGFLSRLRRRKFCIKREARAALRHCKTCGLTKGKARLARKLFRAGAFAQAVWHPPFLGLPSYQLRKLRAQCAEASMVGGAGKCTTTAIQLGFGNKGDPAVKITLTMVKEWFIFWRTTGQHPRIEIGRAWHIIYLRIMAKQTTKMWRYAKGPIGGLICTLRQWGWLEDADAYKMDRPAGRHLVLYRRPLLERA